MQPEHNRQESIRERREKISSAQTEKALNEIIDVTGHFSFAKEALFKGLKNRERHEAQQIFDEATDTFFEATATPNKFIDNLKDALDKTSDNAILSKFTDVIKSKVISKVEYVLKPRTAAYAFVAWSGKATAGKLADVAGIDLEMGSKYVEQATGFMDTIQGELIDCVADAAVSGNFPHELTEFTLNITEKAMDIATYALTNPDSVVLSAAMLLVSAKMVRSVSEKLRTQDSLDHEFLRDKLRNETKPQKKRELLDSIASDPKDPRHKPLMRVMSKITPIEYVKRCAEEGTDPSVKHIQLNEKKFKKIIKKIRDVHNAKFSDDGKPLNGFELFHSLIVNKQEVSTFEDMIKLNKRGHSTSGLLTTRENGHRMVSSALLKGMNKGVNNYAQAVEFINSAMHQEKILDLAGLNQEEVSLVDEYSCLQSISKGMSLGKQNSVGFAQKDNKLRKMKI